VREHASNLAMMVTACILLAIAQSKASIIWTGFNLGWIAGMSRDGSVLVGSGGQPWGMTPFVWTLDKGAFNPCEVAGKEYGRALAVSADGRVVVGTCHAMNESEHAFRWTVAGGLEDLGVLEGYESSWAQSVSADGSIVAGHCIKSGVSTTPILTAFRWTAKAGMENLGQLAGGTQASIHAMSMKGDVMAGHGNAAPIGLSGAFIWTRKGGLKRLPDLDPHRFSAVRGISGDGTVIVGNSAGTAVQWRKGKIEKLGSLAPNEVSWASSVSQDGSVIVGTSGFTAFVWTRARGIRSLRDGMLDGGLPAEPVVAFENAMAVSSDHGFLIVAGDGSKGAFVARMKASAK
jgi:probable HAF family extracellular repeat protein